MEIECIKCGKMLDESLLELNHIIPKHMGGDDYSRAYLCKPCHVEFHKLEKDLHKIAWEIWTREKRWEIKETGNRRISKRKI